MNLELKQHFRIESARHLPHLPEDHPCRRIHGHGFRVTLRMIGKVRQPVGWVRDYHEISRTVAPLLESLDHRVLNEIPGLENPTSENLAIYIFEKLQVLLPELVQVTISETPDTECTFPVL